LAEGVDLHGLMTIDPYNYGRDVLRSLEWDPFSWFSRVDLDKEFGFRIEKRKDLLSGDLKRMYGLAAVNFIQRNVPPQSYAVNLYVDNETTFPKSPVDHQGNVRPSFGEPKVRCTCYTQSDDGQPSASFCWMCCPDPARLRMNYWDQDLKKLVIQTKSFLNLNEKELWEVYRRPFQKIIDEERWVKAIDQMRSETLLEWRQLIKPDAKFGCYFESDWRPEHLREGYIQRQHEEEMKAIATEIVDDVILKSVELLEDLSRTSSGPPSVMIDQAPAISEGNLRPRGKLRDSECRKASGSIVPTRESRGPSFDGSSFVKFGPRNSDHSGVISVSSQSKQKIPETKEALGARFEVYPNIVVINAKMNNAEKIVINLSNYTNIAARVTYALPFQDELVIGSHARLHVTPPKKFFLSPGMVTTMTVTYEPQDVPLPQAGDIGVIKRQLFIKFQPVQGFMEDAATFFGYMLYIKIALTTSPKMIKEAANVSVGYAVKMRQVQEPAVDEKEEDEEDEDFRHRLRRRWESA